MSQSNNSSDYSNDIPAAMFADCLANSKNIFELIDTVFPADSCRHYEVLPLNLTGKNLELGMLDPHNEESLKFVNSIAKVFQYNLSLKLIDRQTLQIILASYPQNSPQSKQNKSKDRNRTVIDATVIEESFDPNNSLSHNSYRRKISESAPTVISQPSEPVSAEKETIEPNLAGLPADLDFLRDLDLSSTNNSQPSRTESDKSGTLYEIPPEFLSQRPASNVDHQQTIIADNSTNNLAESISLHESEIASAEAQISELIAEVSNQIEPENSPPVDFLSQLNHQLSWQKLLEQAFEYGSEAITLIRYSDGGSISAEKDRQSQCSMEQVPLPIFCSLIDEIKRMAKIPLDLSNHAKKVVLERFYQEERILLRLEFSKRDEKEMVIVQIFRDENLKIYEQQQMDKVGDQALSLARQLEKTLRRIQACFDSAEFTKLEELQTIQSRINHQLRLLNK